MPLYLTRRAGESFSVRDASGDRFVRVTVQLAGDEPLLAIEAPKHLRICREDLQSPGDDRPPAMAAAA